MIISPDMIIASTHLYQDDQCPRWANTRYTTPPHRCMDHTKYLWCPQYKPAALCSDPPQTFRQLWASESRHTDCPETQLTSYLTIQSQSSPTHRAQGSYGYGEQWLHWALWSCPIHIESKGISITTDFQCCILEVYIWVPMIEWSKGNTS